MGALYEWVLSVLSGDKCPVCRTRERNLLIHATINHPGEVSD